MTPFKPGDPAHMVEELDALLTEKDAEVKRLREALALALPIIEQGEYLLEECSFSYGGSSYSEPSPDEWGVVATYQQTREMGPHEHFLQAVADFHKQNAEEADLPANLNVTNTIRAVLEAKHD